MLVVRCDAGHVLSPDRLYQLCPQCGAPVSCEFPGPLTPNSQDRTMWRYRDHLPAQSGVSLGEGMTPLLHSRLELGPEVWWKLETCNPTGSQKDRAQSVAITVAREHGVKRVIIASTGSAGLSCAAYAARAGMECYVLCPAETPVERLAGIWMMGAHILPVQGSFEELMAIIKTACEEWGYYNSSTYRRGNPYQVEGPKTIAFELVDQLGGQVPDAVVVPVGGGGTLAGIGKGFRELYAAGAIDRMPRLVGVQNVRFNALELALAQGLQSLDELDALGLDAAVPVLTRNLKHAVPPDAEEALALLRETGGAVVTVSDDEAVAAQRELAKTDGVFAEPSSAVTVAAVRKLVARRLIGPTDRVAAVITGSGFREMSVVTDIHRPVLPAMEIAGALSVLQKG